jgi:hypothetical protein
MRTVVRTVAALLVAVGVAAILRLGQAQNVLNVAGYTWSD